jgi:hypothetical protein
MLWSLRSFVICTQFVLCLPANELKDESSLWRSWHRPGSINVGGSYEKLFQAANNVELPDGQFVQDVEFLSGLESLQEILAQAQVDGKRLRAYGSKMSINNLAYDDEYLVDTRGLNYCKIGIDDEAQVTEKYADIRNRLAYVQSGVVVKRLNRALIEEGLALKTMGSTDGQSLAGAISTGTHGASVVGGSMQDFVYVFKNECGLSRFLCRRRRRCHTFLHRQPSFVCCTPL